MIVLDALSISPPCPAAVAVGFFDGVHRGHQAVIQAALDCRAKGLRPCVFSFALDDQSPTAKRGAKLLQTPALKEKTLAAMGVEVLFLPSFSQFCALTPEQFALDVLLRGFHARVVCCGYDYRFGKNACAGVQDLIELLAPYGVEVRQVPAVLDLQQPISSTRIRAALAEGNLATANRLLGRCFAVDTPVEHGRALGRKLGFPTANQTIGARYAALRFGVYATSVLIDGAAHPAVTNVGVKPTVGSDCISAESYILDWNGDLYGRSVETRFLQFLRPEQRFDSLQQLQAAIARDAAHSRNIGE